jgi:hypothetical protein
LFLHGFAPRDAAKSAVRNRREKVWPRQSLDSRMPIATPPGAFAGCGRTRIPTVSHSPTSMFRGCNTRGTKLALLILPG